MQNSYRQLLFAYAGFLLLAILLTFARRWIRPNGKPSDTWKKYPIYILLNTTFLLVILLPHNWHSFSLLLALIGSCAGWELNRALGFTTAERIGMPVATAVLILAAEWLEPAFFYKIWLVIMLGATAISVLASRHERFGRHLIGLVGCLAFLPLCLASFIWIWKTDSSGFDAIFLYGVISTSDAFAQITGQLVGYRPLAPSISPGKTLEGAAGGVFFAALFGVSLYSIAGWSYLDGALMGSALALVGLIGDLTVSGWKRALGLKDFSRLLGPHGGVLDRFDSLIFAAPIFFLLVCR